MNKNLAKELETKVKSIADLYSNKQREGNYNKEDFTKALVLRRGERMND